MDKDVKDFLEYLHYQRNYSIDTIKSYGSDLDSFISFLKREEIDLYKFDKQDAKNYVAELYLKKLAKKSIVRHISTCRSFYKYLLRESKVTINPFLAIKSIKREKKLIYSKILKIPLII